MMLEVSGLRAFYGQSQALHGLDFALAEGSIVTLLGANGAGKTTTLRALCGMVRMSGEIRFDGKPHRRPRHRGHRAPGDRPCTGSARHLRPDDRRGEPAARRDDTTRPSRDRRRSRSGLRRISAAQRAAPAAGRDLERRRAADAGGGPRADAAAAPDAARRALLRLGAARRRGVVRESCAASIASAVSLC